MDKITTYLVDAFTDQVFKGNPAGVCLLDSSLPESSMQTIAKEIGLSETAFVQWDVTIKRYRIRYFSPKMEIPLCGHATIAASKVLFDAHPNKNILTFKTIENIELLVSQSGNGLSMDFPLYTIEPVEVPWSLLNALGLSSFIECGFNPETKIILLAIDSCTKLRSLKPSYHDLLNAHDAINGVLVTAQSDQENYDFESRYFWPWSGTLEDPATGGTHSFLAPYWSKILGKKTLSSFQCSERTGSMMVTIVDKNTINIKGQAAIFLEGHITL